MAQPQFHHDQYRKLSKKQWEQTAEGWHKWTSLIAQWSEPLTAQMFELAGITTGSHVLDVACGDGSHSIKAARRVGESGYVLATDMAERRVAYAAEAASEAGLKQMEARVMDGENLTVDDQSFDAVICQIGLMLFANPQKGLSEAYRVLKPGGRYAAIVFTTPDKSPWLAIPAKIALEHANRPMPPPGTPGLFALGDQDRLEGLMREVGFTDIESHTMMQPLQLESAAECTVLVRESAGAIKAILADLDESRQQAAWEAIEIALRRFEGPDGFSAPTEVRVVAGTK
jgi:ubiquinone/menaquinone biosynthesis C-methylase UbiE